MDLTRGGPGGLCPALYELCEPVSLTGLQKSPLSAGFFCERPTKLYQIAGVAEINSQVAAPSFAS